MSCISVGVRRFNRADDCVNDPTRRSVGWKARGLVHHGVRRTVNLCGLIDAQEVDAATQQWWQLRQLPYISRLEEEVLVHQQFIDAVGDRKSTRLNSSHLG